MTQREEEAIVLDTHPARDADRTVVLLAASGELVPAIAPSAARSRRRYGGALMPGARVRARWSVRREGALAVLDEAHLLAGAPTPDPLPRYYAAAHLLELARAFAREGAEDPRLYRLLDSCLDRLAQGDAIDPLLRYFEAWLLRLAGLLPDLAACSACARELAGRGLFVAPEQGAFCRDHAPAASERVGASAARWLAGTRSAPPERAGELSKADSAALARLLTGMVERFTERRLRAWPALRGLGDAGGEKRP